MMKSRFRVLMFTVFLLATFGLAACEGGAIPDLPSDFEGSVEIDLSRSTVEFDGSVDKIGRDSWTVEGIPVGINSQTEIEGNIIVGDHVKVEARILEDGSLLALEIKPINDESEDETNDDEEAFDDEFEFTGPVESMSSDLWIVDGMTLTITSQTEIEGQIKLGDLVKVEARSGEQGVLIATEIKLFEEDETDDDEFDEDEIEFTGLVEAITGDVWTVAGIQVTVTSDTEIEDVIEVGDFVKVETERDTEGSFTATEIELVDDDDMDDEDDDGDSDHDDEDEDDEEDDHDDDDYDEEGEDDEDDPDDDESDDDD